MQQGIKIYLIILLIFLSECGSDRENNRDPGAKRAADGEIAEISFREYEHEFGKVVEGEKVAYVFTFGNKGPGDLIITSASTSCGCTVTKFSKNPIPPGKEGTLEVVFDTSARAGIQSKTISVSSNSRVPVVILKISAEVISKQ